MHKRHKALRAFAAVLAAALAASLAAPGAENLVPNAGFEQGLDGWDVSLEGDWIRKVERSQIVSVATEARTGERALKIDTTVLNPDARIEGTFTTRPNNHYPNGVVVRKYKIRVSRKIQGIKPKRWYLAKFHVRSSGIAIDEGLQFMTDIKPWPLRWGKDVEKRHWKHSNPGRGRQFLPQAPLTDGTYHEYVVLKEMYAGTNALEVGLAIVAPWTGTILVDDIELTEVDPDKDMSKLEKLLAMRGTKPLTKVRALNRETTLVARGRPAAAILIPDEAGYRPLGTKIQTRIRELTGARLPVVTKLADVPKGRQIVAVGSMMKNDLVARLHFNRYVRADALSPGAGGYVIWTVAEPYGLEKKQNVIVVAGSDMAGEKAAVDAFCRMLTENGKTIELPLLHTVYPERKIQADVRDVPRRRYGYGGYFNGFTKWYLSKWLETGDPEVGKLARKELLRTVEWYLTHPYFQTAWPSYEVGMAWDAMEEAPGFSDGDRLAISNMLLAYLHMRPEAGASNWSTARLMNNPTWNHQAKGIAGAYAAGRYFDRFYAREDARYAYYVKAARNVFRQQARSSKPQENAGNYWLITMRFSLAYYLGEWDMTFFENGAMRRFATYFATVCNNKGGISGFGDTYYCYHGWRAAVGLSPWEVALGFWYYRDGRMLWWLKHVKPDYKNPYHQDVAPVAWKELLGVQKTPLERDLYNKGTLLALWGSGGEGTQAPVGDVAYEETFDKVSFRQTWAPDGDYLLLEGIGRGIHSGLATNQICRISLLGEDLLIGSTYKGNNARTNDSVIAVRGGKAPNVNKLGFRYAPYAALDALADLPHSGFTRSSMRDFLGDSDWHRNIFWLKGNFFAVIDEIVAKKTGTYYVESNLRTCPQPQRSYPRITPRTWKKLADDRALHVRYQNTSAPVTHYILTDGKAPISTENAPAQYLNTLVVRQVYKGRRLAAGEKLTFINLFRGDRGGARSDYRLERIGLTEGLLLRDGKPVAYFGTEQGEKSKAILPIEAKMFLLTADRLAVVQATSAGRMLSSAKPVTREVALAAAKGERLLGRLGQLVAR